MITPFALVGYMGCGKTHWGQQIANQLKISFLDLDLWLVENRLHMDVADYIQEKGELAFRNIERKSLHEIAKRKEQFVLATGGGTPCYFDNMVVLNANFTTIYLECSIKTLNERLLSERQHRPLIAHVPEAELKEFIAKHLFERMHFYNQANMKIKVDALELESLLNVIKSHEH